MKYIKVKNWEKFQQYKDRDPKWIKLYRDLLNNYEFCHLPDTAKAHVVGIWLLAATLDNKIPDDAKWIATRINATTKINLELLKSTDFIEPYSSVQNDTEPCTESYSSVPREEKRREEKEKIAFPKNLDTEEFKKAWDKWKAYRKDINKPYKSILSEQGALDKLSGWGLPKAIKSINESISNSWQGLFDEQNNNQPAPKPKKRSAEEYFANG